MHVIRWEYYPEAAHHPVTRSFIESMAKRQKRPKTIDAYARNLEDLIRVFKQEQVDLVEAQPADIDTYIDNLHHRPPPNGRERILYATGRGLSDATIRQRIVTARLFYDFCIFRKYRSDTINPVPRGNYGFGGTKPERGPLLVRERLPWIPPDDVWVTLVSYVLQHESLRNQAMILLAYDGALRRQELLSLTLSDIDWSTGLLTIQPESTKSGRMRNVPFSTSTELLLQRYIRTDRRQILEGFGGDVSGPLFLSESHRNPGLPLSIGAFNDVIDHLRQQMDLPQLHPHTFRHLRCTVLKRSGLSLDDIALFAGHKSVTTTQIYLHLAPTELSKRIRSATAPFDAHMQRLIEKGINHE
jgi:integrase/recombinase XerD